jgi:hypothetical protein
VRCPGSHAVRAFAVSTGGDRFSETYTYNANSELTSDTRKEELGISVSRTSPRPRHHVRSCHMMRSLPLL